jgi:hypothetical protein
VTLPGLTVMQFPGSEDAGFVVVADAWVEKLKERGGEQGVLDHFEQILAKPTEVKA